MSYSRQLGDSGHDCHVLDTVRVSYNSLLTALVKENKEGETVTDTKGIWNFYLHIKPALFHLLSQHRQRQLWSSLSAATCSILLLLQYFFQLASDTSILWYSPFPSPFYSPWLTLTLIWVLKVLILSQVLEKFCQGEARCALLVSEVRVTRPLIGRDISRDLILASDWSMKITWPSTGLWLALKQLSSLSLIGYSHLLEAQANRSMYRSKVSFKFNFSWGGTFIGCS